MKKRVLCQARRVCRNSRKFFAQCDATAVALVEGTALCWVHHATLALGRASISQLIEGQRKPFD